jgi:hypothetical protein
MLIVIFSLHFNENDPSQESIPRVVPWANLPQWNAPEYQHLASGGTRFTSGAMF